jgi:hypothetical protein
MIIRREQMQALGQAALRAFEDEMVVHLADFSPPLFRAVKEDQLRIVIRLGIARAGEYGITFRGPIRLYLELMLLFGSHFDTDPQYPWATEILKDQAHGLQMQRAERLYEKTREYREAVAGPEDAYTLRALSNISVFARQPLRVSLTNLVPSALEEMAYIYPQKKAYVGASGLETLIRQAVAAARICGFSTDRAVTLVVVLMFAFGHGCLNDPLYPWIATTLEDDAIGDSDARARRLERRALTWLDNVLGYFDEASKG